MSFLIAAPELVAAAAADLATVGSTISVANAAAAFPTAPVMAAGADEVSATVAALFGAHALSYGGAGGTGGIGTGTPSTSVMGGQGGNGGNGGWLFGSGVTGGNAHLIGNGGDGGAGTGGDPGGAVGRWGVVVRPKRGIGRIVDDKAHPARSLKELA